MAYTHNWESLNPPLESAADIKLLMVGPKDTQMGGAKATFSVFLTELMKRDSLQIDLVSSGAPAHVYNNKKWLINSETVTRTIHIFREYLLKIRSSDVVFVFSNNALTIALIPIMILIAKLCRKPFFHRPIGGDLDTDLNAQHPLVRKFVVAILNRAEGIFAQTRLLQTNLQKLGCSNVYYVPGCRPKPTEIREDLASEHPEKLRLLFLSQIKREKGPFYLLEALQRIAAEQRKEVTCDFYGPIFDDDREEFMRVLDATPNASYEGIVEMGQAARKIAEYDVLVLPTYYACEGHPGVIIEAMLAGVPIISTIHRSIPELIDHGQNGLLVPTHDVESLMSAIKFLSHGPDLVIEMGNQSRTKSRLFFADTVVSEALNILLKNSKQADVR